MPKNTASPSHEKPTAYSARLCLAGGWILPHNGRKSGRQLSKVGKCGHRLCKVRRLPGRRRVTHASRPAARARASGRAPHG